jgi:hypothetical protein
VYYPLYYPFFFAPRLYQDGIALFLEAIPPFGIGIEDHKEQAHQRSRIDAGSVDSYFVRELKSRLGLWKVHV